MADNGYVTRDEAEAAQGRGPADRAGRRASPPPGPSCRRATISPTRSAASSRRSSATRSCSPAASPSAPPSTRSSRTTAAEALRDGLEKYDRGLKVYRGPVARDRPGDLRPRRRGELARRRSAAPQVPRDIAGWHPAVILSVGESAARIGVEDVPEAGDGDTLGFADASWARVRDANGRLRAPRGPADLWKVGDVDLRQGGREGRRLRPLVLPPDPGDPGRLHGDGHPDRPRPGHAGRLLLPVERLQPRHPGAAPAGLVVQALRLCRRPRQRLLAGDDRARRADRGGDGRRHLEAGELGQHLLRPDADAHRHRAVAQPDDGAHRPGHRHGPRRASTASGSASTTTCRRSSAIRSGRARRRSTRWSRPMPSSPTAG